MSDAFVRLTPLERVVIFTPLGIRFWDVARDVAVADGLAVTAWQQDRPARRSSATLTAAGVYAFHRLVGMRTVEYPPEGGPVVGSPPTPRRYVVAVADSFGRFLPTVFRVDVPFRGVFPVGPTGGVGSPPPGPPGVYLFSAPTRAGSADLAVIRADLLDANSQEPAAHAVVVVATPDGMEWYGLADARGSVAVAFPYPRFAGASGSPSPVGEGGVAPWPVVVRVRYRPSALVVPPGATLPDLGSILSQPAGLIWTAPAGPPGDQWSRELVFGQTLVLRTSGESALWIGSAASP